MTKLADLFRSDPAAAFAAIEKRFHEAESTLAGRAETIEQIDLVKANYSSIEGRVLKIEGGNFADNIARIWEEVEGLKDLRAGSGSYTPGDPLPRFGCRIPGTPPRVVQVPDAIDEALAGNTIADLRHALDDIAEILGPDTIEEGELNLDSDEIVIKRVRQAVDECEELRGIVVIEAARASKAVATLAKMEQRNEEVEAAVKDLRLAYATTGGLHLIKARAKALFALFSDTE